MIHSCNRVSSNLFLSLITVPTIASNASNLLKSALAAPTDRVFIVDISGSMAGELPLIRKHLKSRLSMVAAPGDRVSIIAFSGRKQCTRVLTGEDLHDASTLVGVHAAIDRWLNPIGLTAFVDPLKELSSLLRELRTTRPHTIMDVVMMSDGQETTGWTRAEILSACDDVRDDIDAATVVEYGMWADRSMLTAIAEHLGASLAYVNGATQYATLTEQVLQRKVAGRGKKVPVNVGSATVAFSLGNNEIITYAIENGQVFVPDGTELVVLSAQPLATKTPQLATVIADMREKGGGSDGVVAAAYAAVALLSIRSQPKAMYDLLRALGDKALIEALSVCFGKQAFTSASALAQAAAFDSGARYVRGFDQACVPKDDAFTIVDLAKLLVDNECRIDSRAIVFSRIGPKLVDSANFFLQRETEEMERLFAKAIASREVDDFASLNSRLTDLLALKGVTLVFTPKETDNGELVDEVVWNMERPNLSLRVRIPGTVDLRGIIPTDLDGYEKIPTQLETSIYRTRPIVASGIRNVDMLPVFVSEKVWEKLAMEGLVDRTKGYTPRVEIDLARVPMCNGKMRDSLSAKELVGLHFDLITANAFITVLDSARKAYPKANWLVDTYGPSCAAWLDSKCIKPYGFSPNKMKHVYKSGDKRDMRQMDVKIASYSSLPSVGDVRTRLAEIKAYDEALATNTPLKGKGKKAPALTPSMEIVNAAIKFADDYLVSDEYTSLPKEHRAIAHTQWLDSQLRFRHNIADNIRANIAKATFTSIVGQAGFTEFAGQEMVDSYDVEVTRNGRALAAKIVFETKSVEL